jgi:hypothetical protein
MHLYLFLTSYKPTSGPPIKRKFVNKKLPKNSYWLKLLPKHTKLEIKESMRAAGVANMLPVCACFYVKKKSMRMLPSMHAYGLCSQYAHSGTVTEPKD